MKRTLYFICGICWFLFAIGFGWFLIHYVAEGAGVQSYLPILSIEGILMGVVGVIGMALLSAMSFVVGVGLCAHSTTKESDSGKSDQGNGKGTP